MKILTWQRFNHCNDQRILKLLTKRISKMGVRLLNTYLEKYVRHGVLEVDIQSEVEHYKRANNNECPLIVVDLLSIAHLFYASNHEIILGGRYNVYTERCIQFLDRLKSLGIKLVFFTDGPTQAEKIETCVKRCNEDYATAMDVLNGVYLKANLNEYVQNKRMPTPSPFFQNFKKVARRYGDLYLSVFNECDLELAEYATRHNALAVISNDTDFLIYPGNWRCWSSKYLNVDRLTTCELNREALRQTLGLRSDQMPILATMSGNDIVPYDEVKGFHRFVKRNRNELHFKGVAEKIQRLRLNTYEITEYDIERISQMIFHRSKNHQEGMKQIELSLNSYKYNELKKDTVTTLSPIFANKSNFKLNYVILANIKYIFRLFLFDLSKNDIKPFFEIICPLIRRIMGILLKNNAEESSRTFYSKLKHEKDYEEIVLTPEYPDCNIPPLENLLVEEMGKDDRLDKVRAELTCWLIGSQLTVAMVESLPCENFTVSVTLLYLVKNSHITTDEADCLLLACNCPESIKDSLQLENMKQIDERDARIAFLFVTVRTYIRHCFRAVGWTKREDLLMFDGLYFHSLRRKWNSTDKTVALMPYATFRIYVD